MDSVALILYNVCVFVSSEPDIKLFGLPCGGFNGAAVNKC